MGENGKRATRTCTRHPGVHNLANMTRAPSGQTTRPDPNGRPRPARPPERTPSCRTTKRTDPNGRRRPARPNDPTRTDALTRHDRTTRPERTHMGANGKRAARTCTRHPGGHNLANLTRAPSGQTTPPERTTSPGTPARTDALTRHDRTTRPDPNGRTWDQTANGPPGRAQGTRAVTT